MTQITASVAKDGGGLAPLPVCGGVLFVSLVFCLLSFILPPPHREVLRSLITLTAPHVCLSWRDRCKDLDLELVPPPSHTGAAAEDERSSSGGRGAEQQHHRAASLERSRFEPERGRGLEGKGAELFVGGGGGEHRKTALICGVIINGSNTPPEERAL